MLWRRRRRFTSLEQIKTAVGTLYCWAECLSKRTTPIRRLKFGGCAIAENFVSKRKQQVNGATPIAIKALSVDHSKGTAEDTAPGTRGRHSASTSLQHRPRSGSGEKVDAHTLFAWLLYTTRWIVSIRGRTLIHGDRYCIPEESRLQACQAFPDIPTSNCQRHCVVVKHSRDFHQSAC